MRCYLLQLNKKAYGTFCGLALGDAAGMPFEMLNREKIKKLRKSDQFFYDIAEDHFMQRDLKKGEVTDDTLLTMHLAQFLIDNQGKLDRDHYFKDMAEFIKENKLIQRGVIGPSTGRSVSKIMQNQSFTVSERAGFSSGLAMKITPLALIFKSTETEKILKAVEKIAYYSHYTDAAISAAAAVVALVSSALENHDFNLIINNTFKLMQKAENHGLKTFQPSPYRRSEFLLSYIEDKEKEEALDFISQVLGTGINSFEVLPAALAVFKLYKDQPDKVLEAAVGLGGDTDTIAALTGSFIGAYHGSDIFDIENLDYLFKVNDLNLKELADNLIQLR